MVSARESKRDARPGRVPDVSGRETKAGLVQVTVTLAREHLKALREEAHRRAAVTGSGRLDASAVLREVLDRWLGRQTKR